MYHAEEGEELPEWVKNEQENFQLHRDKDGDGFMDNDEVIKIFYFEIFSLTFSKLLMLNIHYR